MRFGYSQLELAALPEVEGDAQKNDILTGRVSPNLALDATKVGGSYLEGSAGLLALLVNGRDGYGVSAHEPGYQESRELVAGACSSRAHAP